MEYYYCPSLLKLLRYLWVSLADRTRVSRLLPPLLPGSAWPAAPLCSLEMVVVSRREGVGGSVWEAEGLVEEERVLPTVIGGHRGCPSGPRGEKQTGRTTTFPESTISLIYEMVLYSEITSFLPLLCPCKMVSSFMRQKE